MRLKEIQNLNSIEKDWKVKLPFHLKSIIKDHNKSYPENYVFDTEKSK